VQRVADLPFLGRSLWLEKNMLEGMREVLGSEAPISVEITVADNWSAKQSIRN
jgi:hypothetical protein